MCANKSVSTSSSEVPVKARVVPVRRHGSIGSDNNHAAVGSQLGKTIGKTRDPQRGRAARPMPPAGSITLSLQVLQVV